MTTAFSYTSLGPKTRTRTRRQKHIQHLHVSVGYGMDGAAVLLPTRSGYRGIFRCHRDTHTTLLGLQKVSCRLFLFYGDVSLLVNPCQSANECVRYRDNNWFQSWTSRFQAYSAAQRPNPGIYDLELGEDAHGARGRYSFSSNNSSSRLDGRFKDEPGGGGQDSTDGKGPPPCAESPVKLSDADVTLEWKSSWEKHDDVEKAGGILEVGECSVMVGQATSQHSSAQLCWKELEDGKEETST